MPSLNASAAKDEFDDLTGVGDFVRSRLVALIRHRPEIERAVIYGSRARGDYVGYSDIDLALYGDGVTRETVFRLKNAIDDSTIVFPVDVTAVSTLPPDSSIRRAIDRDGIVIYERDSDPAAATAR